MIAHQPFFEALASTDERSDRWKSVFAGLLVLRLADAWIDREHRRWPETGDVPVHEALSNLPDRDPVGPLLRDVVARIEQTAHPSLEVIAPPLRTYAMVLQDQCERELARDVFETLFHRAAAVGDYSLAVDVGLAVAKLWHWLGRIDIAEGRIAQLETYANLLPDEVPSLRCQLMRVSFDMFQGRLKNASTKLHAMTPRVTVAGNDFVQGCVAHAHLDIAWRMRRPDVALRWGYQALQLAPGAFSADSVLNSIAATHMVARQYGAAQKILADLTRSGTPEFATVALANLAEVALMQSDRKMFEYYAGAVTLENLFPSERPHFCYIRGLGHRRFGRHREGVEEVREALRMARQYRSEGVQRRATRKLREWGIRIVNK